MPNRWKSLENYIVDGGASKKSQVNVTESFNLLAVFKLLSRQIMCSLPETVSKGHSEYLHYKLQMGFVVVKQREMCLRRRLQQGLVSEPIRQVCS